MSNPDYITLTTLLAFLVESGDKLTLKALEERVRNYPGFTHFKFPKSEHMRALAAIEQVKEKQKEEECSLKFVPKVYGSEDELFYRKDIGRTYNESSEVNRGRTETEPSRPNRCENVASEKAAVGPPENSDYITLTTLLTFLVESGDRELTLKALEERVRNYPGFKDLTFPESEHMRALEAIKQVKRLQKQEVYPLKYVPARYGRNDIHFYQKSADSNAALIAGGVAGVAGGATVIAGGAAVATPFLAGFTTTGVVAGSAAAAAQAAIGNVVAGTWFATLQSIAATTFIGTVAAPVLGAGAVVIGVAAIAGTVTAVVHKNKKKK